MSGHQGVGEKYGWLVYQDGLVALYNILTDKTILGHPAPSAHFSPDGTVQRKGGEGEGGCRIQFIILTYLREA